MSRRSSRKTGIPSYAEASEREIEGEIEIAEPSARRTPRGRKSKAVKQEEERGDSEELEAETEEKETAKVKGANAKKGKTAVKQKVEDEEGEEVEEEIEERETAKVKGTKVEVAKKGKTTAVKRKVKDEEDEDEEKVEEQTETKVVKKRKTKEEKEQEAMPLATRTLVAGMKRKMFIGAHVSGAGGVQNSIPNAVHIGANAFALFLKSQRKWASPPLAPDVPPQFRALCKEHAYDAAAHILPHGSYLVNLAQADAAKAAQAYDCFLDDLQRCEALGIGLYNFHPGNSGGLPREQAIGRIAAQLNRAHAATARVVTVLENMAGAGNVIGAAFEDLRDIIALVDDKTRVGVCLDTCHAFAAGYDLRSPEAFAATMRGFDEVVGNAYLKALHVNDSKTPLGSRRDLHANIGTGFLGLEAFWNVVNYAPFEGLAMVLETPIERKGPDGKKVEDKGVWAGEIRLLEGLVGADLKEWSGEAERLQEEGRGERERCGKQVEKKAQKTLDGMVKKGKRGKKAVEEEIEGESADEGGCKH